MTKRVKRLNIGNSDRHFNVNVMRRKEIEEKTKITRLNEKKIEEAMDVMIERSKRYPLRDGNSYIIYQERYTNDRLIQKLAKHAGQVTYYTDTIIPYYVIKQLADSPDSECIYAVRKEFNQKEVENIELCSMATNVVIDVPIILPDTSPYDLLFSLHALKTHVEEVQLSFPSIERAHIRKEHLKYYTEVDGMYLIKPKYQYEFFNYVQRSLSIWKMNLWLVAENEFQYKKLHTYIEKEKTRRYPSRHKRAKAKQGDVK